MRFLPASLLAIILVVLYQPSAHAYIDPGMGSLIIQGLIGAFMAAALTFKMWWYRLTGFFKKKESPVDDDQ
jgi:hypothetical protein